MANSDTFSQIGVDLLREYMFPELSSGELVTPRIPLMNTMTRQLIAETIYFLVKDNEDEYKEVLLYLSQLVPYDANPKAEGMYLFRPQSTKTKYLIQFLTLMTHYLFFMKEAKQLDPILATLVSETCLTRAT